MLRWQIFSPLLEPCVRRGICCAKPALLLYAPVRKRSFTSFLLGLFPSGLSISFFYASSFDQAGIDQLQLLPLVDEAF
jgi:hypothetical protein